MDYKKFSNTDLTVSAICLGTVNYGTAMKDADAKHQMSKFIDLGGTFIDTAHVYGDWEPPVTGRSERVIGSWLKDTGLRSKVVLATKGAHPRLETMNIPRCSDKEIAMDLDESLSFLNTDYIDLYFLHRDHTNRPVGEILECLEDKVRQGKIRYYGCSNWKLERLIEAQEYAKAHGLHGFVCNQLMWSLAEINFENLEDQSFILMDKPTYQYHSENNLNAMAYMSVAKGYFARLALGEDLPWSVEKVYGNEADKKIYARLKEVTGDRYTITDISLKYLMVHPFASVPIASFDNDAQLEESLRCCDLNIPEELLKSVSCFKRF